MEQHSGTWGASCTLGVRAAELVAAEPLDCPQRGRDGGSEHLGEQMAGGMAAGDWGKGLASVTQCCYF